MKVLKTQGSKEILIEMDKGRLRSLEKCFLWEEMLRWRTKIKGKKKVNSANGGREVDGRWSKKGKEKRQRSGGPKFWPPHLKLSQKLSQPKKKIFFKVFKDLSKSKFSIQNFHSQILNLNHKFSKIWASDFMIKISWLNFQNFKFQTSSQDF